MEHRVFLLTIGSLIVILSFMPTDAEGSPQVTTSAEACFVRMKITDKAVQVKILSDPTFQFPEEHCFAKCLLENDKIVNAAGKMNVDIIRVIAQNNKKSITEAQIEQCQGAAYAISNEPCDLAFYGVECVLKIFKLK